MRKILGRKRKQLASQQRLIMSRCPRPEPVKHLMGTWPLRVWKTGEWKLKKQNGVKCWFVLTLCHIWGRSIDCDSVCLRWGLRMYICVSRNYIVRASGAEGYPRSQRSSKTHQREPKAQQHLRVSWCTVVPSYRHRLNLCMGTGYDSPSHTGMM